MSKPSSAANDPATSNDADDSVDRLLAMVEFADEPSAKIVPSAPVSPLLADFDILVTTYKDASSRCNTGLRKMLAMAKYGLFFTTFADRYKREIGTDGRGQFASLGKNQKLRPVNSNGQALFFGAVSYMME